MKWIKRKVLKGGIQKASYFHRDGIYNFMPSYISITTSIIILPIPITSPPSKFFFFTPKNSGRRYQNGSANHT